MSAIDSQVRRALSLMDGAAGIDDDDIVGDGGGVGNNEREQGIVAMLVRLLERRKQWRLEQAKIPPSNRSFLMRGPWLGKLSWTTGIRLLPVDMKPWTELQLL